LLMLYGIANCDSCRKAQKYLRAQDRDFRFHDLRTDGLDQEMLTNWARVSGWRTLLNTRSRSWRELSQAERGELDQARALALMLAHPTLIKRPVLVTGDDILVGFDAAGYDRIPVSD